MANFNSTTYASGIAQGQNLTDSCFFDLPQGDFVKFIDDIHAHEEELRAHFKKLADEKLNSGYVPRKPIRSRSKNSTISKVTIPKRSSSTISSVSSSIKTHKQSSHRATMATQAYDPRFNNANARSFEKQHNAGLNPTSTSAANSAMQPTRQPQKSEQSLKQRIDKLSKQQQAQQKQVKRPSVFGTLFIGMVFSVLFGVLLPAPTVIKFFVILLIVISIFSHIGSRMRKG